MFALRPAASQEKKTDEVLSESVTFKLSIHRKLEEKIFDPIFSQKESYHDGFGLVLCINLTNVLYICGFDTFFKMLDVNVIHYVMCLFKMFG